MSSLQDTPGVQPYPDQLVSQYLADGLWGQRRIEQIVDDAARARPDAPAVSDATHTLTHAQLRERSEQAAALLAAEGLGEDDTIVLQMPNEADAIAVLLGCLRLGVRPVLALAAHRATEISGFLALGEARHWLLGDLPGVDTDALVAATLERVDPDHQVGVLRWSQLTDPTRGAGCPGTAVAPGPRSAGADELAFFQLSGGTTGASKLIPRAHREYAYSFLRSNELCGIDADTVLVIPLPVTHNFPMSSPGFLGVLAAGGHVVLTPYGDPASICAAVARHRATHLIAVPPLAQLLLDSPARHDADLGSLRRVLIGGARLAPSVAHRVHTELAALQQVYGMAEGLVCYTDPQDPLETILTTQGRPMSAADEVRVVDPDDASATPLPVGAVGELQVRGPYTIRGYYRPGERELAAFTPDGYYRTGDLVRRDATGAITVVGRVKEQINRGGEKISPAEVENALLCHQGVLDVCVVGQDDSVLGERLVAYVVPRPGCRAGLDRRTLRRHLVGESLAAYKIPDEVHVVETLPTTAVGKISRSQVTEVAHETIPAQLDVLGVGFGPANMALAIALRELAAPTDGTAPHPVRAHFVDAAPRLAWHEGLLFEDASMQVAFAKDLVTVRNPRSEFGFLSFLAERGRLLDFLNRGAMSPLRVEFVEYLRWAGARLADDVSYGARVEAICPVLTDGVIEGYEVTISSPSGVTRTRARHVVLAAGLQPHLPDCLTEGPRVWHSARHLHRVGELDAAAALEVVVIGAGQSAAEIILDLRGRLPQARIHAVHNRFGLMPSDATPYANQIFDPQSVDLLFDAPPAERARIDAVHAGTNDAVVAPATLQTLFDLDYRDRWLGREGVVWHRATRLVDAHEDADGVHIELDDGLTGQREQLRADLVVCATGYRPFDPAGLLVGSPATMRRDSLGRPLARRDHAALWDHEASGQLFLVGQTRHQHGLAEVLLSCAAVRAGEIAATITGTNADDERATRAPDDHAMYR